ncbi:dephospho-CoA kinase [Thiovibrio sp. JS02]
MALEKGRQAGQWPRLSAVAVTGGMGAGKSSVARYLAEISGSLLLDADAICRDLLLPEAPGWLALRDAFGERFFGPDKQLDRPLLRRVLFAEEPFRLALNAVLHPLARREIHDRVRAVREGGPSSGGPVVEVPLLFEAGWEKDFSHVVVVYADDATCLARVMARDAVSLEEAAQALAAQLPLSQKIMRAEHVIDNNGPWEDTCLQILHLRKMLWPEK